METPHKKLSYGNNRWQMELATRLGYLSDEMRDELASTDVADRQNANWFDSTSEQNPER